MAKLHYTLSSPASVPMVFQFATDFQKRTSWQKHLSGIDILTEGPVKVGTKFQDHSKTGDMVLEVAELEENQHLRYHTVESPAMYVDLDWQFKPAKSGTEVNIDMEIRPRGFMKVLWPLMGPLMVLPMVKKDFENLKDSLNKL